MRYALMTMLLILLAVPVSAQDTAVDPSAETESPMPDFEQMRQQLREDYLNLKKEVEDDYTIRIKAIDPGPTDLQLKIEKQSLQEEFRNRKQEILDDYQQQLIKLRDEEAALKGELDRFYYEKQPAPDPLEPIRKALTKPKPKAEEEAERRGSRTIPPFSGKSEIGTKPQFKSKGRAGGLVKSKDRAKQLRERREQDERDDEDKKAERRSVNQARSMFEKNRRR